MTATDVNAFPISGCVIAFQEEDRIADCVASLAFCDEVLVVDSGSEDRTRELAEAAGARVLVNTPFPGHKEQKQLAVDAATHDRVLCLDADERVTDALREEIEVLRSSGWPASAYEVERRNHYLGRVVNHGMFGPERKIRLFDRRQAKWGGTNPHDRVEVDPGAATTKLRGARSSRRRVGPADATAGGGDQEHPVPTGLPRWMARIRDRVDGRVLRLGEVPSSSGLGLQPRLITRFRPIRPDDRCMPGHTTPTPADSPPTIPKETS